MSLSRTNIIKTITLLLLISCTTTQVFTMNLDNSKKRKRSTGDQNNKKKKLKPNHSKKFDSDVIIISDSDDESSDKKKTYLIIQKTSLNQHNGWACGYFAVFNLISMFKAQETDISFFQSFLNFISMFTAQETDKDLNKIQLDDKQKFDNWLLSMEELWKVYYTEQESLIKKHTNEKWLKTSDIEKLIALNFHEKHKLVNFPNISILEKENFFRQKDYSNIQKNIRSLREKKQTQFIIVNCEKHWTTIVITPENIYAADSSPNLDSTTDKNIFLQKICYYFKDEKLCKRRKNQKKDFNEKLEKAKKEENFIKID